MAWHFPARAHHYARRFLTFDDASAEERRRWIESLRTFARKLTFKYGRRLVFKSPLHTARLPLLLEAFPDARLVHVHRDPYAVFQSTRNMELEVEPLFRYQRSRLSDLDERILRRYRDLYDTYLRNRGLVPPGHLIEVAYADLDTDPVSTLERIYSALELPPFDATREPVERYLESIRGYAKNVYPELEPRLAARIAEQWGPCFTEWGYHR